MLRQESPFRPRRAWVALAALLVVFVPAALGAPPSHEQALRRRDRALAAQSRSAVLGLYALQSKLARAQARLDRYRDQADALRRQRAAVAIQLGIARHGVSVTQGRLAQRLRFLYERGGVDPVAVVLGADSLDAALTRIDTLGQVASGDRKVLAQVRRAQEQLVALRRRLADRQRRLDATVRAAAAATHTLAKAEAGRRALVGRLASERRMTRQAIARLEARARQAQQKAQILEAAAAAPVVQPIAETEAVAPAPADAAPAPAPASDAQTLTVVATGYALPGRTATGLPVGWGVAAVDPSVIPLGTRFSVPGYGEAVAADVGGAVHGATIDLWFPTVAQAHGWGRRTVTITLG